MKKTIGLLTILSLINTFSWCGGGSGPAKVVRNVTGQAAKSNTRNTTSLSSAINRGNTIPSKTLNSNFSKSSRTNNMSNSMPAKATKPGVGQASLKRKFATSSDKSTGKRIEIRAQTAKRSYKIAGFDDTQTMKHLKGVDLTKPVVIKRIKKDASFTQHQFPGTTKPGAYATNKGVTPTNVGINPQGRKKITVTTTKPTYALQSTAAPLNDNFTVKRANYKTKGGGTQYFFPNKSVLKAGSKQDQKRSPILPGSKQ